MYSVIYRTNEKRKTCKYKSEKNAHRSIWKWFQGNQGTATLFAPHEEPRVFTDANKLDFSEPKETDFYLTAKWRKLRYQAFEHYGNKCSCCGATPESGAELQVDHIKSRSKFPDLELKLSNLQILCSDCNFGKSNIFSTNWNK